MTTPASRTSSTPTLALKIDIDTDHGCRHGLPNVLRILKKHNLQASFFLSLGPDNMGRAIWRVFYEPGFLKTVRRRGGASTYGWSILFKGFLWPGPILWKKHQDIFRAIAADGHEIGVHAWDHHQWQQNAPRLTPDRVRQIWSRMADAFQTIYNRAPDCAAAPGWRASAAMFTLADEFNLCYMSDTRGDAPFLPRLNGQTFTTPQLPTTMSTLDELVGSGVLANEPRSALTESLLKELRPDKFNCYTLHAEMEGLQYQDLFDDFLTGVRARGYQIDTLGAAAARLTSASLPPADVTDINLLGRTAPVAWAGSDTKVSGP